MKDKSLESLVFADADAVMAYAECQAKHGRVVEAYNVLALSHARLKEKLK